MESMIISVFLLLYLHICVLLYFEALFCASMNAYNYHQRNWLFSSIHWIFISIIITDFVCILYECILFATQICKLNVNLLPLVYIRKWEIVIFNLIFKLIQWIIDYPKLSQPNNRLTERIPEGENEISATSNAAILHVTECVWFLANFSVIIIP